MNRILASILAAALTLSTGCTKAPVTSSEIISTAEQIVSTDGRGTHETDEIPDEQTQQTGFKVSGTKLLDANGNEFIMRGINHPHSWFTAQDDTALEAIAATGANTVRIVCGSGQQYNKDSVESLNKLTDKCKELEMIAILEVHDVTGKDDTSLLETAADYWIEVKEALIGKENYVILNIANEGRKLGRSEMVRRIHLGNSKAPGSRNKEHHHCGRRRLGSVRAEHYRLR